MMRLVDTMFISFQHIVFIDIDGDAPHITLAKRERVHLTRLGLVKKGRGEESDSQKQQLLVFSSLQSGG